MKKTGGIGMDKLIAYEKIKKILRDFALPADKYEKIIKEIADLLEI